MSLGQHTIRVTAEDDFWNTNDKQIDILVKEAPVIQMLAAGTPKLPKNRVKAKGCINTKCPLGDWSKSKSALKEYRKQANIILGPDNPTVLNSTDETVMTEGPWHWRLGNFITACSEESAYEQLTNLNVNRLTLFDKCLNLKHLKEFFVESCLLFGGFTFTGHGNGSGTMYIANFSDMGYYMAYAGKSDFEPYMTKNNYKGPFPKYLHLYSCNSKKPGLDKLLKIDPQYFVGYSGNSFPHDYLKDMAKGNGWGKDWRKNLKRPYYQIPSMVPIFF